MAGAAGPLLAGPLPLPCAQRPAVQPEALETVSESVTLPEKPAVNVTFEEFAPLVMVPLLMLQA